MAALAFWGQPRSRGIFRGGLTTYPTDPASPLGVLGGPVGGRRRGHQGPPQREGQQCPGEALECGWALEGDTHKEIFYAPP